MLDYRHGLQTTHPKEDPMKVGMSSSCKTQQQYFGLEVYRNDLKLADWPSARFDSIWSVEHISPPTPWFGRGASSSRIWMPTSKVELALCVCAALALSRACGRADRHARPLRPTSYYHRIRRGSRDSGVQMDCRVPMKSHASALSKPPR